MVRAGELRHTVRFEQRTTQLDAVGEQQESWLFIGERRASMKRAPGSEVWAADQRSARVPTVFRLRFIVEFEVLPAMRLTCAGKTYDIVSAIDPDGMRAELIITAIEHTEGPSNEG